MTAESMDDVVRNLDRRVSHIEQILPTLATKGDVREEGDRTRAYVDGRIGELDDRIGGLDARLDAKIGEVDTRFDRVDVRFDGIDVRFDGIDARFDGIDARFDGIDVGLDELDGRVRNVEGQLTEVKAKLGEHDVRFGVLEARIAEEGARTRRHFDVVAEQIKTEVKVVADGYKALDQRAEDMTRTFGKEINRLDVRVTRLEAERRKK